MTFSVSIRPRGAGESMRFSSVVAPDLSNATEWTHRQLKILGHDPQSFIIQITEVKSEKSSEAK